MSRRRPALPLPSALILAAACASAPEAPPAPAGTPSARPAAAPADPAQEPVYTPFTERPELVNSEEVRIALENNFSVPKREEGGHWVTSVWLYIRDDGVVERMQLNESSGDAEMDAAALRVASVMRFSPARNRGEPVSVWVSIPITFATR